MTKIRTVIPSNAKPGQSIIQVTHPKTGKPTKILVPSHAIPGEMIELQLPDIVPVSKSPGTLSPAAASSRRSSRSSEVEKPIARLEFPPYNSGVSPPPQLSLTKNDGNMSASAVVPKPETEPLIKKDVSDRENGSSCCAWLCCA